MQLSHIGVTNRSEEEAVRFYKDFLGFDLTREYVVPAELSAQLFAHVCDIKMMVFERSGIKIEVFISAQYKSRAPEFSHFGLSLDNITEVIENARHSGIEHIIGQTKDKTVHFIKDYSGNLIEIKQK